MAESLQLNPVEQELLSLDMHLRIEAAMRDLYSYLPKSDLRRTAAKMVEILKQPKNQILSDLKKGNKLDAKDQINREYRNDSVHDCLDGIERLDYNELVKKALNKNVQLRSCTQLE